MQSLTEGQTGRGWGVMRIKPIMFNKHPTMPLASFRTGVGGILFT